jgi:cysteine desulfurase
MSEFIYLDNAATTRMDDEVLKEMLPYLTSEYANPSAGYSIAGNTHSALNTARKRISVPLGCEQSEIYFTSGGSESDNWALKMAADENGMKGNIITTKIEHHAILNTCENLKKQGIEVTYLDTDDRGMISPERFKAAIRPDTFLASVMFANNEIGTVEPIEKIGMICRDSHILFHTDAVQAFGHERINVDRMHIDMLSASGHKFYGPKGTGFLYIRNGIKLKALINGGAQERNRRAGTENVPGIAGMGRAAELAYGTMDECNEKIRRLRDHLCQRLTDEIPDIKVNGSMDERLANNLSVSFKGIEAESLLILLDISKICVSGGSACTTGALEPSHVLMALGMDEFQAKGTIRFTFGKYNTMEETDIVADECKAAVKRLRDMSPFCVG